VARDVFGLDLERIEEILPRYAIEGPRYTSYPTVPAWDQDFGEKEYREALAELNGRVADELAIYLHLPFCAKACHYCGCNMLVTRDKGAVHHYLDRVEKELWKEAGKGRIKIADTWDDIALWMGVAPKILKATVGRYNASCDRGVDDIFNKEGRYLNALKVPPFHAIRCYSSFLGTIGGIKINPAMEVLDKGDRPIPGLYAAGTDTGGWESDTYCLQLSGSAFGFALNSGRIAGENAAQYVLSPRST